MVNPFKDVNWNPGLAEKRKFATSLVIGFPAIALVFLLVGRLLQGTWNYTFALGLGGGGVAAGLLFWAMPFAVRPFYVVWYFLACCIGTVVSNVLLIGFYYTAVTGIGLMLRALRRDPMDRHFRKEAASYWKDAEKVTDPKRYYSQF